MTDEINREGSTRIAARIDAMPFAGWHRRMIATLGSAHFFDAFDATMLAFVLPVLVVSWKLSPSDVGLLIAIGYGGQMLGAVLLGGLAERFGRIVVLQWSLCLLGGLSLACAMASGYKVLLVLRFIQGVGLGAEVPIAATYVNEVTPARLRGRTVGLFQFLFGVGSVAASLSALLLIPRFGWNSVFIVGAAPLIPGLLLRRILPESPRWLVARGRIAEAEAAVAVMEGVPHSSQRVLVSDPREAATRTTAAASKPDLRVLFSPALVGRTIGIWLVAFCGSAIAYGIITWMPTIYTTVYHLPLETALGYGSITGTCALFVAIATAFLVDGIGRKATLLLGFLGALSTMILTVAIGNASPFYVFLLVSLCMSFTGLPLTTLYIYCSEIYPALSRAFGTGAASAWMRVGCILGPMAIGFLLAEGGSVTAVFTLFAGFAIVGAFSVWMLAVETRGVVLDAQVPVDSTR